MSLRDLGYRAYEGERLSASHNTWVMLRHGLRRAWGSWLVKLAVFTFWVPGACTAVVLYGIYVYTPQLTEAIEPPNVLWYLTGVQLWLFVSMTSLGAGAGAISEDLTYKAFQFYFAKPVTAPQYIGGRMGAVAIVSFLFTFLPGALVTAAFVVLGGKEKIFEHAGLILPVLASSALIAVVTAVASVALSSLSKSRALTMSAWVLLFVVPYVIGGLVDAISEWPWLSLASLPSLFSIVERALFKLDADEHLKWFHAAPVLGVVVLGGILLSLERLRRAEVIT